MAQAGEIWGKTLMDSNRIKVESRLIDICAGDSDCLVDGCLAGRNREGAGIELIDQSLQQPRNSRFQQSESLLMSEPLVQADFHASPDHSFVSSPFHNLKDQSEKDESRRFSSEVDDRFDGLGKTDVGPGPRNPTGLRQSGVPLSLKEGMTLNLAGLEIPYSDHSVFELLSYASNLSGSPDRHQTIGSKFFRDQGRKSAE